jgi:hypothetical protein
MIFILFDVYPVMSYSSSLVIKTLYPLDAFIERDDTLGPDFGNVEGRGVTSGIRAWV